MMRVLVALVALVASVAGTLDTAAVTPTTSLLLRRLEESQLAQRDAEGIDEETTPTVQAVPELPRPQMYSLHVTSHIEYRFANSLITSRLANPANVSQEILFSVVLPETAFISKFLMEIGGKVYEAYVKEKVEAKQEYDAAVASGLGAAHIAQAARDSNRFQVSVNIEPSSKVTFNLTYEELLTRRHNAYNHVINLDPGQIVRDLRVDVYIKEARNITLLRVPELRSGNEIDANENTKANTLAVIDRSSPNTAHVSFAPTPAQQKALAAPEGAGLGGQFVVQYDVQRDPSAGEVLVNNGYFVHFFAPAELKPLRKHALFVLDVSGSMEGRKIEQLKEAMLAILDELNEGDYFNIIEFSYSVTVWNLDSTSASAVISPYKSYSYDSPVANPGPTPAFPATPENIDKAKEIVKKMRAGGGTNIYDTLKTVIRVAHTGMENITVNATSGQTHEPIIVFLTDGEPTVGETRLGKIFGVVQELNNNPEAAIFSLAFGDDADLAFLKKLSLKNSGFARKIYEASDASLQLRDFYRQIASPLLANVTFNYLPEKVVDEATTKRRFHTLFSGSELVVAGKLRADPNTASFYDSVDGVISGIAATGGSLLPISRPIPIDFLPSPPHAAPEVPSSLERLWAYLTIKQLLDKDDNLVEEAFDEPLELDIKPAENLTKTRTFKQQALELALKYSFVTPLTSLVVVKPNVTSAPGASEAAVNPTDADKDAYSANFGPVDRLGVVGLSLPLSGPANVQAFHNSPSSFMYPQPGLSGYPGSSGGFGAAYAPRPVAGYPGLPAQKQQDTYYTTTRRYMPTTTRFVMPELSQVSHPLVDEVFEAEEESDSEPISVAEELMTTVAEEVEPTSSAVPVETSTGSTTVAESSSVSTTVAESSSGSTTVAESSSGSTTVAESSSVSTTVAESSSESVSSASNVTGSSTLAEEGSSGVTGSTTVPEEVVRIVSLEELSWLDGVRTGNDITLPFGVSLALHAWHLGNETLAAPAACTTTTGIHGSCVHLRSCALSVFKDNIAAYEPYFCHIDNYAGSCCPANLWSQSATSAASIAP